MDAIVKQSYDKGATCVPSRNHAADYRVWAALCIFTVRDGGHYADT